MVCDSGALGPAGAACSAHRDVVAGAERLFGGVANARDTVAAGVASLASDGLINASAAVAPALSRMFGPIPTDVPPPVPAPDPAPPPVAPGVNPPPPPGAGGTTSGAGTSGDKHRAGTASVEGLDEQLVATVNEALTGNRVAQDQITGILQEIEARHTQLSTAGPDSAALSSYQQYLDQQLGRVQQILITAQADADAKRQVLDGIAEEYRQTGPAPAGPPIDAGGDGGGGAAAGAGAGGDQGAGAGGAADGTVQDQVQAELARIMAVDPFEPGGGLPGGAADLAAALGPALGGLGGIGGSLAGLGAAPFGALGPALGSLGQLGAAGGAGGGFTDPGPKDPKTVDAGFTDKPKDENTDKPKDGDTDDKPKTVDAGFTDAEGDGAAKDETVGGDNKVQPVSTGPEVRTAPVAAAPATAAAQAPVDAGRSVVLPDGTPVTASNEKAAAATRAVLGGTDVTAAYQAQGVQIPPPGTPVTSPVDPSRLEPGDIASFEGRPPVMAAGNGKVWMDGQLQPLSAMGSAEDFLGWSRPTGAPAAVLTADSPAPAAGTPPVTATPPS
ncbi:Protein of unknown function DUF4226 [Mycobacteriaceae bacterium]